MIGQTPVLSRGMTTPQMASQRLVAAVAKACLSSIPFTALAFDVGQGIVDVANARVLDRFLEDLGNRVEGLEAGVRDGLRDEPLHDIAAKGALRALLAESNERVAMALARAVAELARLGLLHDHRAECARIVGALNEPLLHALQTTYRFHKSALMPEEIDIAGMASSSDQEKLGTALHRGMSLLGWSSQIEILMQIGLIAYSPRSAGASLTAVKVMPLTPLGERALDLCFDGPLIPAFGRFASSNVPDRSAAA